MLFLHQITFNAVKGRSTFSSQDVKVQFINKINFTILLRAKASVSLDSDNEIGAHCSHLYVASRNTRSGWFRRRTNTRGHLCIYQIEFHQSSTSLTSRYLTNTSAPCLTTKPFSLLTLMMRLGCNFYSDSTNCWKSVFVFQFQVFVLSAGLHILLFDCFLEDI